MPKGYNLRVKERSSVHGEFFVMERDVQVIRAFGLLGYLV